MRESRAPAVLPNWKHGEPALTSRVNPSIIVPRRVTMFVTVPAIRPLRQIAIIMATARSWHSAAGRLREDQKCMRSYAQGNVGDFVLTMTSDGFTWEIPAGPMTIRYAAVIKDGALREVGDRIMPDKEPVRFFEMNLKRVGDTNWPAAGVVSPK